MTRDFTRPDGSKVTVEFTYREGSPDTYNPAYGADGGDPPECEIVKAWSDCPGCGGTGWSKNATGNGYGDVCDDCGGQLQAKVDLTDTERESYEEAIYADPPEPDYD